VKTGKTFGSAVIWSALQTGVRLVLGFLSVKVTAIYLGPAGIALTSQVNNLFTLLQGTLGNAVNDGVIKLTAQAGDVDPAIRQSILSTAGRWLLGLSLLAALLLALSSSLVAEHMLGDASWAPLIGLVGLLLPVALFGPLIVSVFSGQKRFDLVALSQVGANVLGAAVFVGSSVVWGLKGGLIGTVLLYAAVLAVAGTMALRTGTIRGQDFLGRWDAGHAKVILGFYPMLLARGAAVPLSLLIVRSVMLDRFGAAESGYWQGAVRLSEMYTLIISTALNMYSLPTLSATKSDAELRSVMVSLATKVGLAMGAIAIGLFLLRHWIVLLVFTAGFEPVGEVWKYLLVADVLQLICVPLRQALMVRARPWAYVTCELLVATSFVAGAWSLMPTLGVQGATLASALSWSLVFALLLWFNRKLLWPRRV
jgi:PST family polysaccharide transporter